METTLKKIITYRKLKAIGDNGADIHITAHPGYIRIDNEDTDEPFNLSPEAAEYLGDAIKEMASRATEMNTISE